MADITLQFKGKGHEFIGPSVFDDESNNLWTLPLPTGYSVSYTIDDATIATLGDPDSGWDIKVQGTGKLGSALVTGVLKDDSNNVLDTHTWAVDVTVGNPVKFTPTAGSFIPD